ncbi:hypothetical protein KFK09_011232 [Dendrobium nobile]|uniref:Uncharacterized protein n=1 Tax=Dendrobium nobile TaxID=94219 RepID=A0A8T3BDY4_DENNO|nr:hypothetical protein KFK09_011232 [Dendrobium nobile]
MEVGSAFLFLSLSLSLRTGELLVWMGVRKEHGRGEEGQPKSSFLSPFNDENDARLEQASAS